MECFACLKNRFQSWFHFTYIQSCCILMIWAIKELILVHMIWREQVVHWNAVMFKNKGHSFRRGWGLWLTWEYIKNVLKPYEYGAMGKGKLLSMYGSYKPELALGLGVPSAYSVCNHSTSPPESPPIYSSQVMFRFFLLPTQTVRPHPTPDAARAPLPATLLTALEPPAARALYPAPARSSTWAAAR